MLLAHIDLNHFGSCTRSGIRHIERDGVRFMPGSGDNDEM